MAHTNLTKVTWMVFVHKNTVVVLTTGVTSTTRVGTVLTDTTVPRGNVTTLLSVF
jgi:hypothetical protein